MIECTIAEGFQTSGCHIIVILKEGYENSLSVFLGEERPLLFEADFNEVYILEKDRTQFFLLGLGTKSSVEAIREAAIGFSVKYGKQLPEDKISLHLPDSFDSSRLLAFYSGFFLGGYSLKGVKAHFLNRKNSELRVKPEDGKLATDALILAKAQITCMDWLNKPANKKNGLLIADFAKEMAARYNLGCTVFNREASATNGLDAYLSVNRGSEHDAAFIILEYKPEKASRKIGLVGKCVTFDTGGISIKPSQNLHYMKSDMGGATAVLGAFQAIAEMKLPVHAIGILPATDNAVSDRAYLPSDVINSHAGKTIEVIDTDAEGRLTLADGLSFLIKNYNPEVVIDLATLTGSAVRTFGYECAALFTKNKNLHNALSKAGELSGEKVWQLPMWESYAENLQSDIADIKNYSGKPIAGAIDAAIFLENFTHEHKAWAHLDIAGVAFGNTHFGKDKTATGYGVHLLLEYIKGIINE